MLLLNREVKNEAKECLPWWFNILILYEVQLDWRNGIFAPTTATLAIGYGERVAGLRDGDLGHGVSALVTIGV